MAEPATTPATAVVTKIIVSIPKFPTIDPSIVTADSMSTAVFHTITPTQPVSLNSDRPNVVSIQRLRPGSQSVVSAFEEAKITGAFDVKIVFTELPHDFKLATIAVDGGTASNLVVGVPFARSGDCFE